MKLGHKVTKGLGVVAALFLGFALAGAGTVATWTELMPAGVPPSARGGPHSAVLDETTNRLIVFGGRAAGVLVNEVWILKERMEPTDRRHGFSLILQVRHPYPE